MRRPGSRSLAAVAGVSLMACFALSACEKIDRNMWDNPAVGPQEAPLRPPPAGSVPTKGVERIPSREEAAKLANPLAGTPAEVAHGKELFGVFCSPCHGPAGKGDGPVGSKLAVRPPDISPTGHLAHHPDGMLFGIISRGYGAMPALAPDLSPGERWKIVAWMRSTQEGPAR